MGPPLKRARSLPCTSGLPEVFTVGRVHKVKNTQTSKDYQAPFLNQVPKNEKKPWGGGTVILGSIPEPGVGVCGVWWGGGGLGGGWGGCGGGGGWGDSWSKNEGPSLKMTVTPSDSCGEVRKDPYRNEKIWETLGNGRVQLYEKATHEKKSGHAGGSACCGKRAMGGGKEGEGRQKCAPAALIRKFATLGIQAESARKERHRDFNSKMNRKETKRK